MCAGVYEQLQHESSQPLWTSQQIKYLIKTTSKVAHEQPGTYPGNEEQWPGSACLLSLSWRSNTALLSGCLGKHHGGSGYETNQLLRARDVTSVCCRHVRHGTGHPLVYCWWKNKVIDFKHGKWVREEACTVPCVRDVVYLLHSLPTSG